MVRLFAQISSVSKSSNEKGNSYWGRGDGAAHDWELVWGRGAKNFHEGDMHSPIWETLEYGVL